jgi:hypothetical protein
MADHDLFIAKEEFISLLRSALASGFRVQVDRNLSSAEPEYCATELDVEQAVKNGQFAFLLERSDFSRYPVKLRAVERGTQKF